MGIKYQAGAVILTDVKDDFPQILTLYVLDSRNLVACCNILSTVSFEQHFHSYRVAKDKSTEMFYLQDISSRHSQIYMSYLFRFNNTYNYSKISYTSCSI